MQPARAYSPVLPILPLQGAEVHDQWHDIRQQVLRLYGVLTAAMIALIETESQQVTALLGAPSTWVGRGALQALLAVLTLELATAGSTSESGVRGLKKG